MPLLEKLVAAGFSIEEPALVLWEGVTSTNVSDMVSGYIALICLILLLLSFRRIGVSYWVYSLYSLAVPLSSGMVVSMPRYSLAAFPLFIALAKVSGNHRVDQALTVSLALVQGFFMVFWCNQFPLIV